jgi:hypothetical protein
MPRLVSTSICILVLALLMPRNVDSQSRVTGAYTFPDLPIKRFQEGLFPGSVPTDRNVLIGSVGSDLWRGPSDAPGEFWMLTDRGPNGQIKVDGKIAGPSGYPNSTPRLSG